MCNYYHPVNGDQCANAGSDANATLKRSLESNNIFMVLMFFQRLRGKEPHPPATLVLALSSGLLL